MSARKVQAVVEFAVEVPDDDLEADRQADTISEAISGAVAVVNWTETGEEA